MQRLLLFLLAVAVVASTGVTIAQFRDEGSPPALVGGEPILGPPVTIERSPSSAIADQPGVDADPDEPLPIAAAETPSAAVWRAALESSVLRPLLPDAARLELYANARRSGEGRDWESAAEGYGAVAASGTALAPIAGLRQAQALVQAERLDEAVVAFEATLAMPALSASLALIAHDEAADALIELGRVQEALAHLDAVIEAPGAGSGQAASAYWERAQLLRDAGQAWGEDALAAVRVAPGTRAATAALDALEEAGVAVPTALAAQARYRAYENDEAEELYTAIAEAPLSSADAATAWFYLGALAERRDDDDAAIEAYGASLAWDGAGPFADDARWWRGQLLERAGRTLEAAGQFGLLVDEFPSSPFAASAAIRAGVALAEAGESAAGAARLRTAAATLPPDAAAEAARWLQLLGLAEAGDAGPEAYDPASFFAVSALDGDLRAALPASALEEWTDFVDDREAADAWMRATFGEQSTDDSVLDDPDLAMGIALIAAGEEPVGRSVLHALVRRLDEHPHLLLEVARVAELARLPDIAMHAGDSLLNELSPAEQLAAPLAITRFAYPLAYGEEVLAAARAEGVPPLLLLALVRQESAFNPQAGSSAGAIGLTQVIDQTGEAIARILEEPWPADLTQPARSLRYGALYLAEQLRRFDGDVLAALAAYNGGPGNAARWQDLQVYPGGEGYRHAVEFAETRLYLEHVIENYAWYRYLYAGAERPAVR